MKVDEYKTRMIVQDEFDKILELDIKTALDAAGGFTYTVVFSQADRKFTISAGSAFSLLNATGTNNATSLLKVSLGYANADTGSLTSHEADDDIETAGSLLTSAKSTRFHVAV